ncbi:MAG: hypothetical protein JWM44_2941 [Bacilli bacterium]|jgi:predicted metal-binding membrane protein|nr:hypothetical protein [Bacilli bacterium]
MYFVLAMFAAILGLAVTAAAVFTIWSILQQRKESNEGKSSIHASFSQQASQYFLKWTVFDYSILILFAAGMLFLFVDVIGVMRERQSYPFFHYGYLLSGFLFSLLGMLFIVARLVIVLRLVRVHNELPAVNDHHKPNEANAAE